MFSITVKNFSNTHIATCNFKKKNLSGCAFAVDKSFFESSGSFDPEMRIWGGENVELSVRVWRCGGSMLKVPCARVGHVYR